jgi:DNA-binding response OmpR family regulator
MMKCLLVEDDVRVASFIEESLTDKSFQVYRVADGFEAVSKISNNEYDVVILDIMLPGIDGFEICKIKLKRKIASIIIILSALVSCFMAVTPGLFSKSFPTSFIRQGKS